MYHRNQRACRVQPLSAELILWITGHVCSMALKSGGPCTFWLPCQKVRWSGPQDRRHCNHEEQKQAGKIRKIHITKTMLYRYMSSSDILSSSRNDQKSSTNELSTTTSRKVMISLPPIWNILANKDSWGVSVSPSDISKLTTDLLLRPQ